MTVTSPNWILLDSKVGSNVQAIALADELGIDYNILDVKYNFLANLPNFLLPKNLIQVSGPDIKALISRVRPKLIISASRKTALVSAAIKNLVPDCKNIQILRPELPFENFDLVILPQHDKNIVNSSNNILRVIGSLCSVQKRIDETLIEFRKLYGDFVSHNFAAVLVGGDTKKFRFDEESCKDFFNKIDRIASANRLKLFVTFSRRTPEILKRAFLSYGKNRIKIYDPKFGGFNPYPALLKDAKFVISTCDSISMCSEVASLAKPFYLYIPKNFTSSKHLTFAYQLQDLGISKVLHEQEEILQEYQYINLNECRKAADYVLATILSAK